MYLCFLSSDLKEDLVCSQIVKSNVFAWVVVPEQIITPPIIVEIETVFVQFYVWIGVTDTMNIKFIYRNLSVETTALVLY